MKSDGIGISQVAYAMEMKIWEYRMYLLCSKSVYIMDYMYLESNTKRKLDN